MKKIQLCTVVLLLLVAGTAFASGGRDGIVNSSSTDGCLAQFFGGEGYGGEYMLYVPNVRVMGFGEPNFFVYLQYEPSVFNPLAFFMYNSWGSSIGFSGVMGCSTSALFSPYGLDWLLHVPQVNVFGTMMSADFIMGEESFEPDHSGIYFDLISVGPAEE